MPAKQARGETAGRTALRRAAVLGWGVLAVLYSTLFLLLWRGMQEQERGTERLVATVTSHVAQLTTATLQNIDRSLIGLRRHVSQLRITRPELPPALAPNLLADVRSRHPELLDLRVVAVDPASWIDRACESRGAWLRVCVDAPFERDGAWRLPLRLPLDDTRSQWIEADLDLGWLQQVATQQQLGETGSLLITHQSGAILAGSGPGTRTGSSHPPIKPTAEGEVVVNDRPRIIDNAGTIDTARGNIFRYAATRPMGSYPLQVTVGATPGNMWSLWLPAALLVLVMLISGVVWWIALRLLARNDVQQKAFANELQQTSDALRQAQEIAQLGGWSLSGRPHRWQGSRELAALLTLGESISAQQLGNLLPHDDLQRLRKHCAHPSIRRGELDLEIRLRRPEGNSRVLRVRGALHREGRQFVLRGTAQDITDGVRVLERLRDTESRYRFLFANNPMPLWIVAADDLRFLEVNTAARAHYQRSETEFRNGGLDTLLLAEDRPRLRQSLAIRQRDERSADLWRHVRGDGTVLHVLVYCVRMDYQGVSAWLMLSMDISDWIQAEQERAVSEQRFQLVAQATSDAVWDLDLATHRLWWSESFYETFGFSREEVGDDLLFWLDCIHPDDRPRVETSFADFCNGEMDRWQESYRFRDKTGHYIDVNDQGKSIRDDSGRVVRVVGGMVDASERHRYQRELSWQASHDALTGLPNRAALTQRITAAVQRAERDGTEVCVLLIDLDHFKLINDSLGHAMGDDVLRVIALRLSTVFSGDALVGRFGGDEFVAVIPHAFDRTARQHLLQLVAEPVELVGGLRYVTPSIGIARHPQHGGDAELLLKHADLAMYHAKQQGRNTWVEYDSSFESEVDDRLDVVSRLRRALDDGEFVLHFQPQYTADSREMTGVETLVRWQHPEKGLLPPAQFIPICEESGLIIPLGRWILREACRHHALLQQVGLGDLTIAINVSAAQFLRGELIEDMQALMVEYALPYGAIELELTESVVMESPELVIAAMLELRDLGVSMSLDDFGTGYSSLAYLKRLPLDRLKIDRAFVHDLPNDQDDAAICTSIIVMAAALGLRVVAEGVESVKQLDWLADHGCHEVQGYLLAHPLPFDAWLASVGHGAAPLPHE